MEVTAAHHIGSVYPNMENSPKRIYNIVEIPIFLWPKVMTCDTAFVDLIIFSVQDLWQTFWHDI